MDQQPASVGRVQATGLRGKDTITAVWACLVGLAVLAAFGALRYGSIRAAVASAGGHSLLTDEVIKPLGAVSPGEASSVSFTLRNLTGHPIRLQGAQTSCSCSVVAGIPCSIEAQGTRTITATVMVGNEPEDVEGSFQLFTDDEVEPIIRLGYSARVVPAGSGDRR